MAEGGTELPPVIAIIRADITNLEEEVDRAKELITSLDDARGDGTLDAEDHVSEKVDEARAEIESLDGTQADVTIDANDDEAQATFDRVRAEEAEIDGSRAEYTIAANDEEAQAVDEEQLAEKDRLREPVVYEIRGVSEGGGDGRSIATTLEEARTAELDAAAAANELSAAQQDAAVAGSDLEQSAASDAMAVERLSGVLTNLRADLISAKEFSQEAAIGLDEFQHASADAAGGEQEFGAAMRALNLDGQEGTVTWQQWSNAIRNWRTENLSASREASAALDGERTSLRDLGTAFQEADVASTDFATHADANMAGIRDYFGQAANSADQSLLRMAEGWNNVAHGVSNAREFIVGVDGEIQALASDAGGAGGGVDRLGQALGDAANNGRFFAQSMDEVNGAEASAAGGAGALMSTLMVIGPELLAVGEVGISVMLAFGAELLTAGVGLGAFALAATSALHSIGSEVKYTFQLWQDSLQSYVMPVVQQIPGIVAGVLNDIRPLVIGASQGLSEVFRSITADLNSPEMHQFTDWLGHEIPAALMAVNLGVQNWGSALSHLGQVATPIIHDVETGFAQLGQDLDHFATGGGFANFIGMVQSALPVVSSLFSNVWGIVEKLATAFGAVGAALLPVVADIAGVVNALLSFQPLTIAIAAGATAWGLWSKAIQPIGQAISGVIDKMVVMATTSKLSMTQEEALGASAAAAGVEVEVLSKRLEEATGAARASEVAMATHAEAARALGINEETLAAAITSVNGPLGEQAGLANADAVALGRAAGAADVMAGSTAAAGAETAVAGAAAGESTGLLAGMGAGLAGAGQAALRLVGGTTGLSIGLAALGGWLVYSAISSEGNSSALDQLSNHAINAASNASTLSGRINILGQAQQSVGMQTAVWKGQLQQATAAQQGTSNSADGLAKMTDNMAAQFRASGTAASLSANTMSQLKARIADANGEYQKLGQAIQHASDQQRAYEGHLSELAHMFSIPRATAQALANTVGINLNHALSSTDFAHFASGLAQMQQQLGLTANSFETLIPAAATALKSVDNSINSNISMTRLLSANVGRSASYIQGQWNGLVGTAQSNFQNIHTAMDNGLNPQVALSIMKLAPAQQNAILQQMVGNQGAAMIALYNNATTVGNQIRAQAQSQAQMFALDWTHGGVAATNGLVNAIKQGGPGGRAAALQLVQQTGSGLTRLDTLAAQAGFTSIQAYIYSLLAGKPPAHNAGQQTSQAYGQGLQSGKGAVTAAGQAVANSVVHPLSASAAKTTPLGQQTAQHYADGIRAHAGAAGAAAVANAHSAGQGFHSGVPPAHSAGSDTGHAHAQGIQSTTGDSRGAAHSLTQAAGSEFAQGGADARQHGVQLGQDFGQGITSSVGATRSATEQLINAAKASLTQGGANARQSGVQLGQDFAQGIQSEAGQATAAGHQISTAFGEGAADTGAIGGAVRDLLSTFANEVGRFTPEAADLGQSIVDQFGRGISGNAGEVQSAAQAVTNALHNTLQQAVQDAGHSGSELGQYFSIGISSEAGAVSAAASADVAAAMSALSGAIGQAGSIGAAAGSAFASSLESNASAGAAAAQSIASAAAAQAKATLQVHSPSRVFWEIGESVAQGLAQGITDNSFLVSTATDHLAHTPAAHSPALAGVGGGGGAPSAGAAGGGTTVVQVFLDGKEVAPALVKQWNEYQRRSGDPLGRNVGGARR